MFLGFSFSEVKQTKSGKMNFLLYRVSRTLKI